MKLIFTMINKILPREVRRDKILGVLKANYGIDHTRNSNMMRKIKENRIENGSALPPLPDKSKDSLKPKIHHGVFMNSVQLVIPRIAASEKEAIMSKK